MKTLIFVGAALALVFVTTTTMAQPSGYGMMGGHGYGMMGGYGPGMMYGYDFLASPYG